MDKVYNFIKKNYKLIIIIFCLFLTLLLVEDVFENETMRCDTVAYDFFVDRLRDDNLTVVMKAITDFGNAIVLVLMCILSYLFFRNKKVGICVTSNLIIVTMLNLIIKSIVSRPRPEGYRLIIESGYSFPSGHSMVSVAFYGYLIYLICRFVSNKKIKIFSCTILSLLILLVGASRIYLGVHYASDVIAGALISIMYLIIYVKVTDKYIKDYKIGR